MLQKLKSLIPVEGMLVLIVAGCMLLVGWVKGINLLILLTCVVISLGLLNAYISGRQIKRIHANRRWDEPIFAGASAHWSVELKNRSLRPAAGIRIRDDTAPDLDWFVDQIGGDQSIRLPASSVFAHRGTHQIEPLSALCLYPFGLARRRRQIGSRTELVVLPRLGSLNMARFRQWLNKMLRSSGRVHRLARPSMIHQDDLHGLRAFRPGDNPRWIHWRTSARRNLKMVREFEESSGLSLIVLFDPSSDRPDRLDPELESALSLAATICWELCSHHEDHLALWIVGASQCVIRGRPSRALAIEMLRTLATVQAAPRDAVEQAFQGHPIASTLDVPVLLIGARPNDSLCGQLLKACRYPVVGLTTAASGDFYEAPGAIAAPVNRRAGATA